MLGVKLDPGTACQVAVVLDVAVSTCPELGAVAAETSTVVVADLRAFVIPEVSPDAVPVRLVATPEAGVPSAGATKVLLESVCVSVSPTIAPDGAVTADKTPDVSFAIPDAEARFIVFPPVPENRATSLSTDED